jgi:hypothetical protein
MKKVLLLAVFAFFSIGTCFSQGEVKIGVNAALPLGDADDGYTFGAIADFAYLFDVNDVFKAGPMASFLYYFGDEEELDTPLGSIEVEFDDAAFLPIGGTARFMLEEVFFGADLGYAIGISPEDIEGGFYYRPEAGYNFGAVAIVLSYSGIALDGGNFNSLNAGVEFGF